MSGKVPTAKNFLLKEIDVEKSFIDQAPNEIDLLPSFTRGVKSSVDRVLGYYVRVPSSIDQAKSFIDGVPSFTRLLPSSVNRAKSFVDRVPSSVSRAKSSVDQALRFIARVPSCVDVRKSSANLLPSSVDRVLNESSLATNSIGCSPLLLREATEAFFAVPREGVLMRVERCVFGKQNARAVFFNEREVFRVGFFRLRMDEHFVLVGDSENALVESPMNRFAKGDTVAWIVAATFAA